MCQDLVTLQSVKVWYQDFTKDLLTLQSRLRFGSFTTCVKILSIYKACQDVVLQSVSGFEQLNCVNLWSKQLCQHLIALQINLLSLSQELNASCFLHIKDGTSISL